jgi:CRISPR-associated protein Csd1
MSILEALVRLAETENLVSDPDFQDREVAWLVPVTPEGRLLPFRTTRTDEPQGDRRKPRRVAKVFQVPRQPGRTSGDRAFFLCDKSEYVFGQLPESATNVNRPPEQLRTRARLFRDRIAACVDATADLGAAAILKALDEVATGQQRVELPLDCAAHDLFAFIYTPDGDRCVHERPAIRDYWARLRGAEDTIGETVFQCSVTGRPMGTPGLFPQTKRVPGGTTSGVSLVSFNERAFESFGLSRNENAPISRPAAEKAATALERLVHPAPTYAGQRLSVRRILISDDTVVAFWASDQNASGFLDVFANLLEVTDPAIVADVYQSVWRGRPVEIANPGRFYALTLSGAQGRLTVRDWFESSVTEVSQNLARHFSDLSIVRNSPKPKDNELPPQVPLSAIVRSLAPFGKFQSVPASLVADFVDAALRGTQYPLSLLQRALERTRAEIGRTDWSDLERRDARAALIKAVLERRRRMHNSSSYPELTPAMDPTNRDNGYLLGRLLAVLERLQQLALQDINASVVDRYFGSASATPRAVFPRLLRNARHHARKAKDEPSTAGTARWLDRMIDEIAAALSSGASVEQEYRGTVFTVNYNGFPTYLPLDQQGLFVLGYHHQRHQLWAKRTVTDGTTEQTSTQTT